jgi:hypothetical protein
MDWSIRIGGRGLWILRVDGELSEAYRLARALEASYRGALSAVEVYDERGDLRVCWPAAGAAEVMILRVAAAARATERARCRALLARIVATPGELSRAIAGEVCS